LIGRGTDGSDRPNAPDIDGLGWVDEPAEEIATWSAMIVPIRLGGGTRIKLAEAFSRKVPTVATTLGAFGYEVQNGNQLMIADRADDFSSACISLLQDPKVGEELANRAWNDYLSKWTWNAILPKVKSAVDACLAQSEGRVR